MAKKLIISILLGASLMLGSCVGKGQGAESTAADITTTKVHDKADTTEIQTTEPEKRELFEIRENGGTFDYKLFNRDGSVAEGMTDCESAPVISVNGDLIRVDLPGETYYYDLEARIFSESFNGVFDENGSLLITVEDGKIVICDIFDESGFYTEIDDFTYELHGGDEAFVSVEFADGGQTVKCIYLSGSEKAERVECFNITDKTRSTVVEDWRNKKELLSGDEKARVETFLGSYMGTVDYNTGFSLDYEITGAIEINGVRYYHCECYYLMESEVSEAVERVLAAEFVLSDAKSSRYDCREADGTLIVYTEKNMI